MAEKSGAQTFERGLDILWHFIEAESGTSTMNEVVAHFGISRSTAYRLVKILRDRYILEDAEAEGSYRLGPRVLQLASSTSGHDILRQLMLPYMSRLVKETQETVILTVKHGLHSLCVEHLRSPQSINFTFEKNRLMPLHAGASAKILLAFVTPIEQRQVMDQEFTIYTPTTPANKQSLERDLAQIRQQGYAITFSEVDPDSTSVAVPLLSGKGKLLAGLSIGGPSFRMTEKKQFQIIEALRGVSEEATRQVFQKDAPFRKT